MAKREFLKLLRRARAGNSMAQLLLGKIFLSGGYGLAPNPKSAFLWLSRAAQQGSLEAQIIIGSVFPPSFTHQLGKAAFIRLCYQAAADAGIEQARDWLLQITSPKKLRQILQMYFVPSFIHKEKDWHTQVKLRTYSEKRTYMVS